MHPKILQLVDRPESLSVDKHQDLTRRTHHQDPCGRQGPFPRNVLVQVTVEGPPSISQLQSTPSMPRLAAAYTPRLLPVQFPGTKPRQLGETYLESRLGETHLEHECRRETPRSTDPSQYLNKLTRVDVKALQPLKWAHDPYQVPVNLT